MVAALPVATTTTTTAIAAADDAIRCCCIGPRTRPCWDAVLAVVAAAEAAPPPPPPREHGSGDAPPRRLLLWWPVGGCEIEVNSRDITAFPAGGSGVVPGARLFEHNVGRGVGYRSRMKRRGKTGKWKERRKERRADSARGSQSPRRTPSEKQMCNLKESNSCFWGVSSEAREEDGAEGSIDRSAVDCRRRHAMDSGTLACIRAAKTKAHERHGVWCDRAHELDACTFGHSFVLLLCFSSSSNV